MKEYRSDYVWGRGTTSAPQPGGPIQKPFAHPAARCSMKLYKASIIEPFNAKARQTKGERGE